MPPKGSSSNKQAKPQGPTKKELEAINDYLAHKPDFNALIKEAKANPQTKPKREEGKYERALREAVSEVSEERRKEVEAIKKEAVNMPVLPKEDGSDSSTATRTFNR